MALTLGMLIQFSALALDGGLVFFARNQLQAACDAAAMSGSAMLDGTSSGITSAIQAAKDGAKLHSVLGTALTLASSDVTVGTWDPKTSKFTTYVSGTDPSVVNAVKVSGHPSDASPLLGQVAFGAAGYSLSTTSLSMREFGYPSGSTICFLPFAVPDCTLTNGTSQNPPPYKFGFASNSTIGWGDPDANPNSSQVRDQLLGTCSQGTIVIGQGMYANTGTIASALSTSADILNGKTGVVTSVWDTVSYGGTPKRDGTHANLPSNSGVSGANWGATLEGPVPLVDAGKDCTNPTLSGSPKITGFAWALVYDVKPTGSSQNIWIQLDITKTHLIWGKPNSGAKSPNVFSPGPPVLVAQ